MSEPKPIFEAGVAGKAHVGFSRDAKSLIAYSENGGFATEFTLPNKSGKQLNQVAGRNRASSYNPLNRLLLIGHDDTQSSGKMIIDVQHLGSPQAVKQMDVTGSRLLIQHSGDRFAVSNKNGTAIYRAETFTRVVRWPLQLQRLDIGTKEAAAYDGKDVLVLAYPSGNVLRRFPRKSRDPGLAFIEATQQIAFVGPDFDFELMDSRTGKTVWRIPSSGATSAIVVSPNHKYIAFGTLFGGFRVARVSDGKIILTASSREAGSVYPTMGVDWSADSRTVAAGFDTGEVKAWDLGKSAQ